MEPPGERRVYRVDDLFFRVWIDQPNASAELYRDGEWVPTAIPSGGIIEDARAEELSPEEARQLGLAH